MIGRCLELKGGILGSSSSFIEEGGLGLGLVGARCTCPFEGPLDFTATCIDFEVVT